MIAVRFALVRGATVVSSRTGYIVVCWLASRTIVAFAIGAHGSLSHVASAWDGAWYRAIATGGYDYVADGRPHAMAFFPLYPLLIAGLRVLDVPVDVGALCVGNLAFFATLFAAFDFVATCAGVASARAAVAVVSFCPLSLFGSVAYADGLFMFVSTLALTAFARARYRRSAVWAALSSLARPNGVCLAAAFLFVALARRTSRRALLPALGACAGPLLMAAYGDVRFHDPLAFVHAQRAWRAELGGGSDLWRTLVMSGSVSFGHWRSAVYVVPLAIALVVWRERVPVAVATLLWSVIVYDERQAWGRDFPFEVLAVAGVASLVAYRRRLGEAPFAYALVSLVVLLLSGSPVSADRYLFAVVPFPFAIGMMLARLLPLAPSLFVYGALDLHASAAKFARGGWVA